MLSDIETYMCALDISGCGDNVCASSFNGTDDRAACTKEWYAVLVGMNAERRAASQLRRLHIECFVPVRREIHMWSDRRKRIDRIVIPMIVFLHIRKSDYRSIRDLSFVHKFISFPGSRTPAVIPDTQIEQLRFMADNADGEITLCSAPLSIGSNVIVVRGPLRGLVGELCLFEEEKTMVAIRLDGLGYAGVSLPKTDIEAIGEL